MTGNGFCLTHIGCYPAAVEVLSNPPREDDDPDERRIYLVCLGTVETSVTVHLTEREAENVYRGLAETLGKMKP